MKYVIYDNHNISELDELKSVVEYAADKLNESTMEAIQLRNHDWCLDYAIERCSIVSVDPTTAYVSLISGRDDTIGHLQIKHTRAGCWEIKTDLDSRIALQYLDQVLEYAIYDALK